MVRRLRLPPPAASTIYELTERGRELEPVLLLLMRWGSSWMTTPPPGSVLRASWFALALKALVEPAELAGIRADFELVAGTETIHLRVADGDQAVDASPVPQPDARLIADPSILFRIASGNASVGEEVAAGRATVEGATDQVRLLVRTMTFPRRPAG